MAMEIRVDGLPFTVDDTGAIYDPRTGDYVGMVADLNGDTINQTYDQISRHANNARHFNLDFYEAQAATDRANGYVAPRFGEWPDPPANVETREDWS